MTGSGPLLIVAGEASGDLHGARLAVELRRLMPGLSLFGLGGDELRAAGLESVAHSAEISVVGITEVLRILKRARQIFDLLLAEIDRRQPAAAVLIDFPEFNLRLARELNIFKHRPLDRLVPPETLVGLALDRLDLLFGDHWRIHTDMDLFFAHHQKNVKNFGGFLANEDTFAASAEDNTHLLGTFANNSQFNLRVTYQF